MKNNKLFFEDYKLFPENICYICLGEINGSLNSDYGDKNRCLLMSDKSR